ncbi:MAG: phosphoglucomutase, partial [bacterium]
MDATVLAKAKSWAENAYFDDNFRKEIQTLIDENQTEELGDRFYKNLEFGTGGLRGILGAGSNRVNIYTVRRATQGLATYMNQNISGDKAVVIACDNRRFSDTFVQESASVLAGNGIKVHVFPSLRPTPMLSFAVRELKATAGIVITASHNPPEYNGYKVSWDDGCQVTPPHDKGIIDCVNSIEDFAATVKTIDYEE